MSKKIKRINIEFDLGDVIYFDDKKLKKWIEKNREEHKDYLKKYFKKQWEEWSDKFLLDWEYELNLKSASWKGRTFIVCRIDATHRLTKSLKDCWDTIQYTLIESTPKIKKKLQEGKTLYDLYNMESKRVISNEPNYEGFIRLDRTELFTLKTNQKRS